MEDSQNDNEGNKDAARALMRVKQKLDGYEDGEMRSVHGQVNLVEFLGLADLRAAIFHFWVSHFSFCSQTLSLLLFVEMLLV